MLGCSAGGEWDVLQREEIVKQINLKRKHAKYQTAVRFLTESDRSEFFFLTFPNSRFNLTGFGRNAAACSRGAGMMLHFLLGFSIFFIFLLSAVPV